VATIVREKSNDQGTPGKLYALGQWFYTLELPERDNKPYVSRIPEGVYLVEWTFSKKFERYTYELSEVDGRWAIRIHPGNWAGDVTLGFITDLLGCIALGEARGTLKGQIAVLNSRSAVEKFQNLMEQKEFILTIKGDS